MKCEYCGRKVSDMPDHLKSKPQCSQKHAEKLRMQFKEILVENDKVVKFFKEKGGD